MKKLLLFIIISCSVSISSASNNNIVIESLCDFLVKEGLINDSDITLSKVKIVKVEELLHGGKDLSRPFGVYVFNKMGAYDFIDYVLIKSNEDYWIYKENNASSIISHLLSINKAFPSLLSDDLCFEYIKRIVLLNESQLCVGQKRGMFIFVDTPLNVICK